MATHLVPFDTEGNMLDYEGWGPIEWRPNAPFTSAMRYLGYSRGRSSVRFNLEADDGTRYSMTMTEYMKILESNTLVNGDLPEFEWHIVKRGANYGLERANA